MCGAAIVEGAIATVARRGAEEAGAIFVIVDWLDGTADLFGPAPQSALRQFKPADRLFQRVMRRETPVASDRRAPRQGDGASIRTSGWSRSKTSSGRSFLDLVEE